MDGAIGKVKCHISCHIAEKNTYFKFSDLSKCLKLPLTVTAKEVAPEHILVN